MSERYFVKEVHSIEDYWSQESSLAPVAAQLSKGPFSGRIEMLLQRDITIVRRQTSQWTSEFGFLPPGESALSLHSDKLTLYAEGVPYTEEHIAGLSGGNPYQFIAAANARIYGLRLNHSSLEKYTSSATLGRLQQMLQTGQTTKLSAGNSHIQLQELMGQIFDRLLTRKATDLDSSESQAYLAEIRQQLFQQLKLVIESAVVVPERLNSRSRLFQKAIEIIDTTPLAEIDLTQLADSLGTSRRNVELVFSERLNITPKEFINNLRLNQTRRRLLMQHDSALTISQIAQECGINHMGNFARNYAAMFNELPSQTLERAQLKSKPNSDTPASLQ